MAILTTASFGETVGPRYEQQFRTMSWKWYGGYGREPVVENRAAYEADQFKLTESPFAKLSKKRGCEHCGNLSGYRDKRGNCASCGAPLE